MITRWNSECVKCMTRKYLCAYPENAPEALRMEYLNKLFDLFARVTPEQGAPVVTDRILKLQESLFGKTMDYTEIKRTFNQLMLQLEDSIQADIQASETPLKKAIQYVMTGNYIDFGALSDVSRETLFNLLSQAGRQKFDENVFNELCRDLASSKKLVYLTDNCGEIVLDKLFIKTIRSQFPDIDITAIVRGKPALNDATIEDAIQTGLTSVSSVIGNGTGITGTYLPELSEEASEAIHSADVLIAKGQGNFETLRGCGLNVYYLFLCKCELFTRRFHTDLYEGILTNDKYY